MTGATENEENGARRLGGAGPAVGPLVGKTALVTGGSRGVGRGIVERLVRDGAVVVIGFRQDADAAAAVAGRMAAVGGLVHPVRADLTRPGEVARFFAVGEELTGGIDILVNNAAIMLRGKFADATEEDFDRIMALNVKVPFLAIQQAAHRLRDGGRIVNISSTATALAHPSQAAYSASKAALDQLTKVAAKEFAKRGITVNTVSPGGVETEEVVAGVRPEVLQQWRRSSAFGRLGLPQDIADVVGFLVGPDARWLSGQNLQAAGGAV
ncbi:MULTISPECIES: SDR family oxidoreductase [Kitasatospora]|uniref:SDR family oxidoreductase n=1 Tax=Kitasatospora TaxID=2063 RepID=UPI000CB2B0F8|nr:SDR family oxidoreductase [Kitasatospora sp. GP30]MDH6145171.1 3-oxoacyl-[acyl-carrier protein] reductase [Kitasatospora sp. GP30]